MKAFAEFVPGRLAKVIDMARNVASFANLDFRANGEIELRLVDPAKIVYVDIRITPTVYKCDTEFSIAVQLSTFYKLIKSLDPESGMTWTADETSLHIAQTALSFVVIAEGTTPSPPSMQFGVGNVVSCVANTKLFQRYTKAVAMISPTVRLKYMEALLEFGAETSLYKTKMALDVESDDLREYEGLFLVKFVDSILNTGISDKIEIRMSPKDLTIVYRDVAGISVSATVMAYTEG